MDLCLIQNCRFFIGCQSGLLDFANLASKNILLTNMYHWFFEPALIRGRGILQRIYSKKDKRYLSIKELLSIDMKTKIDIHLGLTDKNYIKTENSAGEILKAVLEYMGFLKNDDLPLTFKQKEFNKYRQKQGYRLIRSKSITSPAVISPMTHSSEEEMVERYRQGMLVDRAQGTLCASFLEEYW